MFDFLKKTYHLIFFVFCGVHAMCAADIEMIDVTYPALETAGGIEDKTIGITLEALADLSEKDQNEFFTRLENCRNILNTNTNAFQISGMNRIFTLSQEDTQALTAELIFRGFTFKDWLEFERSLTEEYKKLVQPTYSEKGGFVLYEHLNNYSFVSQESFAHLKTRNLLKNFLDRASFLSKLETAEKFKEQIAFIKDSYTKLIRQTEAYPSDFSQKTYFFDDERINKFCLLSCLGPVVPTITSVFMVMFATESFCDPVGIFCPVPGGCYIPTAIATKLSIGLFIPVGTACCLLGAGFVLIGCKSQIEACIEQSGPAPLEIKKAA